MGQFVVRRYNTQLKMGNCESGTVTVYEHAGFQGACKTFGVGSYDIDAIKEGFGNDKLRSLKVCGDVKVKLYQHACFKGQMMEFCEGDHDIGELSACGFNDQCSSVIVENC